MTCVLPYNYRRYIGRFFSDRLPPGRPLIICTRRGNTYSVMAFTEEIITMALIIKTLSKVYQKNGFLRRVKDFLLILRSF